VKHTLGRRHLHPVFEVVTIGFSVRIEAPYRQSRAPRGGSV
jgi:hypothetical protein